MDTLTHFDQSTKWRENLPYGISVIKLSLRIVKTKQTGNESLILANGVNKTVSVIQLSIYL